MQESRRIYRAYRWEVLLRTDAAQAARQVSPRVDPGVQEASSLAPVSLFSALINGPLAVVSLILT